MAIMDYIQSGVEKVLRPKRRGIGGMGPGIGSSTGVAQFQDDVRISPYASPFFSRPFMPSHLVILQPFGKLVLFVSCLDCRRTVA